MEGTPRDNLRKQLEEREAEVVDLRDRLEQAQTEIDRLREENGQLRKELKAAGRGKTQQQSKHGKFVLNRRIPGRLNF
jgi:regulator of replication initiation timing